MPVIEAGGGAVDAVQEGRGRDLVLLHTLLAERSVYDRVLPALARARRVTLLNFPGYGGSGPAGRTVADYADRVAAAMDALGLPTACDVLGNGFGGFVATALAARHGGRFERLVLVDTAAAFPEAAKPALRGMAEAVRRSGMAGVLETAVARMFPPDYIAAHPEVIAERKDALRGADPELFATACLALTTLDHRPLLAGIRNPTLVVVGSADATTPPALARELAAGIPGAQLIELPGLGHCPQVQDPAAFLAAVAPFLDL